MLRETRAGPITGDLANVNLSIALAVGATGTYAPVSHGIIVDYNVFTFSPVFRGQVDSLWKGTVGSDRFSFVMTDL